MTMPNKLFPGLPDYSGPTKGYFTLLHHAGPLVEYSEDVNECIAYINGQKPQHERAIRLRHIVYVPSVMFSAKWRAAHAKRRAADAELGAAYADKLLPYLQKHVPDCKWNGKEIMFQWR